ncbi:MAG: hypothetical protein R3E97_14375 [Candidatus Eisenbacteria bacterium]
MSSNGTSRRLLTATRIGGLFAPALAASLVWAAVPCDQAAQVLQAAPGPQRMATATEILKSDCQPLLPEIATAIRTAHWADSAPLSADQRISLLHTAIAEGYGAAAEVAVQVLEKGAWPDGTALDPGVGAQVVEALAPALDRYRVLLLLDVYEQVQVPAVSLAVVKTLEAAKEPEALLPALDASWNGKGEVQVAASKMITAQPEKTPAAVLLRLAKTLPKGPALDWVGRLGAQRNLKDVADAIANR